MHCYYTCYEQLTCLNSDGMTLNCITSATISSMTAVTNQHEVQTHGLRFILQQWPIMLNHCHKTQSCTTNESVSADFLTVNN